MPKFDPSKLESVHPDVRSRIESALARTLEAELAVGASNAPEAATHSRSRGAIFSRSRTADQAQLRTNVDLDTKILEKIDTLDDAAFQRFTSRLATLKGGGK